MGQSSTSKQIAGQGADPALNSIYNFPNEHTPTEEYLHRYRDKTAEGKKRSFWQHVKWSFTFGNNTLLGATSSWIGNFILGGVSGAFLSSIAELASPSQLFPSNKLDEYVTSKKRLNFDAAKILYLKGRGPFIKGGVFMVSYALLFSLLSIFNQKRRSDFVNNGIALNALVLAVSLRQQFGVIFSRVFAATIFGTPILYQMSALQGPNYAAKNAGVVNFVYDPKVTKEEKEEHMLQDRVEDISMQFFTNRFKIYDQS
eukprot:TRINITY_DN1242_c0_g1_i2.p1 TRINITY_DN1242_c0_g1~~TRINITY_DN1242_c0_g1_i2.p1  ORF type:complete len:257 (+),score=24.09 TRINITY_DN1242_c0_g1_i2:106-876(+)